MTKSELNRYRKTLQDLRQQVNGSSQRLETDALRATGGEAAGGISNAPMHLGDVGADAADQELNATLLENEEFLGDEIAAAIARIDAGKFGVCEACSEAIPAERLDILPYARYCVPCTEKLQAGGAANMNDGRPSDWAGTFDQSVGKAQRSDSNDSHATGTPGGGSALGGLAGTNVGDGEPDDEPLETAMASGSFDIADESDEPEPNDAYSGPSGGAIGGSPANKRSTGGRGPR